MSPDDTESTPLLYPSNTSVILSEDDDTISSADLRERHSHTRLASSYRRPSFVAGGRGLLLSSSPVPDFALRDDEAFDCVREERGLLKRNSLIPVVGVRRGSISTSVVAVEDVEETWDDAVKGRKIKTSWRYELGVLARFSVFSLIDETDLGAVGCHFLYGRLHTMLIVVLQQSLALASVLSLGHLGTTELGGNSVLTWLTLASALATMTATITGTAIFQGIAT